MARMSAIRGCAVAAALSIAACALPRAAAAAEPTQSTPPPVSHSGYERIRSIGGPDSVHRSLRHHDVSKDSFYRGSLIKDAIHPYYRFKRDMKDRYGLAFGFDFNMLYEGATASLSDREAAGGVFRLYAHWTAVGRGTPTTTEFVFRIENRHTLGTDLAPSEFGPALGSLFKTANSFDGWGWGLTNLQLQQWFEDGRYGIAVGQVDLRDWVDTFELSNWRTMLLSAAVTYPTNPLPSAGLGGAVFAYFRKRSTPYVLAGFSDANGKPYDVDWRAAIDAAEFYSYAELGWTPSFDDKDEKNLRVTYWHRDPREAHGDPEGWGLSCSAAWKFADRYSTFLRAGIAEGGVAPAEAGVVAGLGIHRRSHDVFGVALGWGRPHEDGLRDQTTLEVFYRLQISQNVGITPDVEVLFDPSKNPNESVIGVFSLRLQLAF